MIFYGSLLVSLGLDLITKYLATHFIQNQTIFILNDILSLHYVKNTGIAFSLPITGVALKIFTLLIIIYLGYYYFHYENNKKHPMVDLSFGLILGGAFGNAFERVLAGEVVDFISIKYFAIFNIADVCISLGAIVYIYYLLKNKSHE